MIIVLGIFIVLSFGSFFYVNVTQKDSIKVGVLFSETGTMAESEQPVINAVLLAIDEINTQGGINGRRIVPVVYDAESKWKNYAQLAEKMIVTDNVKVIFGCWTSAARKEVKPVVEKYNNLLIYPTQYEGAEQSANIIYLGATPNQQIVPAVSWSLEHVGKRVFLVGSNYIFPYVANEVIKHEVNSSGGKVVGEAYLPLGSSNVDPVLKEILKQKPDIIFNTINGNTNVAFLGRLYELTKNQPRPVVMSFSLSNADINKIGAYKIAGDYAARTYFRAIQSPENKAFLTAYQAKYGTSNDINNPAATAYAGVYLWAQAAREAMLPTPAIVRDFMLRQSVNSPAGVIYIDPVSGHAWRTVLIGKADKAGAFQIVWSSLNPIPPVVYPNFKTKVEWDLFEYQLYSKWRQAWENDVDQGN